MYSATCGTTALPRHLSRSIRLGIPSATRSTLDSLSRQDSAQLLPVSMMSASENALIALSSPLLEFRSTPKAKRRSLTCPAPKAPAGTHCHAASYPLSAKSPRTRSSPRIVTSATFSTIVNRGRKTRMTRCISTQSPLPSSLPTIPALKPSDEMSTHGNPPQIKSTRKSPSACGNSLMSLNRGMSGQCFASTDRANGSISTCQRHAMPARSSPRSNPPMPANRLPKFMLGPFRWV